MTKRQLSLLILFIVLALAITACGQGGEMPGNSPTEPLITQGITNELTVGPTVEPADKSTDEPTVKPDPTPFIEQETPSVTEKVAVEPETVQITVDSGKELFASGLKLGATHTHYFWEKGKENAVDSARVIFDSFSVMNNQHIMGWGANNPWPKKDGEMDFASLDYRIELMKSLDGEPMITFCQAPGWMKGEDDWAMEADVLDEYMDDFAYLSAEIAKRYPDVKYFQVWNEFKGYYNSKKKEWDYERYTALYNKVYTEVKKVRPDALVGGFYLVIEGDGSSELFGIRGTHDFTPLNSFQKRAISYWLENKSGADFICIDQGIRDYHNKDFIPTAEQTIALTTVFEKVVRELTEMTDLPIFYSEFYGYTIEENGKPDRAVEAAQYASLYKNMIMGSRGREITSLLWVETEDSTPGSLFTDTDTSDGGKPFSHAQIVKYVKEYFGKGNIIVEASADVDKVIVLASKDKIMIINPTDSDINVQINKTEIFKLGRFEVKFIDN